MSMSATDARRVFLLRFSRSWLTATTEEVSLGPVGGPEVAGQALAMLLGKNEERYFTLLSPAPWRPAPPRSQRAAHESPPEPRRQEAPAAPRRRTPAAARLRDCAAGPAAAAAALARAASARCMRPRATAAGERH